MERQHEFADVNYKEVHDIIFPADVRATDSISAKLTKRGSDDAEHEVRVWKLSPLGIEIIIPDLVDLAKGEQIDLQLQVARQSTVFEGLIVDVLSTNGAGRVAGIRLSGKKPNRFKDENRRKATRWQCSSQFHPVATCANPVQFNDFIYFRLKDISGNGFRVITSLRNKFLVPGMQLSLQISFPMVGYCNITTRITRANLTAEDGKDFLELGLSFRALSTHDREIIGQYLIQFSDADSLDKIREEGLYPKSLVTGLDYTFVKTEQEFLDSLKLRHSANLLAGKIPAEFDATEMSDIYDARSRIINWTYRDKCVGTVRTTFCEIDEPLELEQFAELPASFPRRDEIAEIGRLATHPEYRRGDLFYNVLQRVALLCLQANRSFALISTTKELLPLYERVGLSRSQISYVHPLYPEQTQYVLSADIKAILSGTTVGFFAWNLVWKEVLDHVIDSGICEPKELITSKTRIYRLLAPFAFVSKYFMARPRKSKRASKPE